MTELKTLTVYCGSSGSARAVYNQAAENLGRMIGASGRKLVYGGMDTGLMGLIARNAMQAGAMVTGIIPKNLKDSERVQAGLHETILVGDLWERKELMFRAADVTVALPGGFGTLDEALEILYWSHLGLHGKPLAFVDIEGYWERVIDFLKAQEDFDARFMIVANGIDDLIPALESWKAPEVFTPKGDHFPNFETEITRATDEPIFLERASLESAYYAACALGLKQLGKHGRAIGFLNKGGQFGDLLAWIDLAAREHFITPKCLQLYSVAEDEKVLRGLLKIQAPVAIDLHAEKWGPVNGGGKRRLIFFSEGRNP